jgi:hypothetical protein
MSISVASIDLVKDGVLVIFSDGTAAIFSAVFHHAHRNDTGNTALPSGRDGEKRAGGGNKR